MLDRDSELGYPPLDNASETFVPQGDHRRSESLMEWQSRLDPRRFGETVTAVSAEMQDVEPADDEE